MECKFGKVYIGQTGLSTETRFKEHEHVHLYQPEKSAVAEHSAISSHWMRFQEKKVLAKISGYMDRLINKKAIEIKLHPDDINRKEQFILSKAWNPSIKL
jgi:hypothetical protein